MHHSLFDVGMGASYHQDRLALYLKPSLTGCFVFYLAQKKFVKAVESDGDGKVRRQERNGEKRPYGE